MSRRKFLSCFLVAAVAVAPGCLFRKKKKDPEEVKIKTEDVYGVVQKIDDKSLVIQPKGKGPSAFVITHSSVRGSDFKTGALVHVFYQARDGQNVVTMVVEKVK